MYDTVSNLSWSVDIRTHGIVNVIEKWVNSAIDSTAGVRSNSLSSFVDDPTPEQHLHKALDGVQKLLERFAGDKSLNDLF